MYCEGSRCPPCGRYAAVNDIALFNAATSLTNARPLSIEGLNTQLTYYPDDKLTVVVLANVNGAVPGDIAATLAALAHGETVKLSAERKEITLDPKAKEIQVSPQVLAKYAGTYELGPGVDVTITVDGGRLMTQITGQPKFELFAESETKFFLKVVEAQVEFFVDTSGAVTHIVVHQSGRDTKAIRK